MDLNFLWLKINSASNQYNKLVILMGPSESGKTRLLRQLRDVTYINLSKELAGQLSSIPNEDRSIELHDILRKLISSASEQILVMDNIELLFLPELQLDPLKSLSSLSRNKTLVVAWTGSYDGKQLTWAEPGHPEYRVYDAKSCPGIIVKLN